MVLMLSQIPTEVYHSEVTVGLLVLSIGLSILAGQLLKPKSNSPIRSDKPATLATRGSSVPWYVGVRRVGPVFAAAFDRVIRKERASGGKGLFDSPKQEVTYEGGWHIIGVGPLYILYSIIQAGEVIFEGPITNVSHPSGTTVDLGREGSFTIYWGEMDQPVNTYLGVTGRVEIESRWPGFGYIQWNSKRLNGGSTWPSLDYVVGRRPSLELLTLSPGWREPGQVLTGDTFDVDDVLADADPAVGYLLFNGDVSASFRPLTEFTLAGNTLGTGPFVVRNSSVELIVLRLTYGGFPYFGTATKVFIEGGTAAADANGTASTYERDLNEGANIAHCITELLFAPFPQGLGLNPAHTVESWDLDSLEAMGVEAAAEDWYSSISAFDGEQADAVLGSILQDIGCFLPLDPDTGSMTFQRIREPVGTPPDFSLSTLGGKLPQGSRVHAEGPVDRLIYRFSDRNHNYADMTLVVDNDGQASYLEHLRYREVPLVSTVHFPTAAKLVAFRQLEELPRGAEFVLPLGREARGLKPGDYFTAEGYPDTLLVTGSGPTSPDSEVTEIRCMPNFYGVPRTSDTIGPPPDDAELLPPIVDPQFMMLEMPEQFNNGFPSTMAIGVLRLRAHVQIKYSSIYLSGDDITYELKQTDPAFQAGGVLNAELTADGPSYSAQSVEYTELGPDDSDILQDLSADLPSWGAGRQVAVIFSDSGFEICFLQKATITSGTTRRLDGLLRGRFDTRKLDHAVGSEIYIFNPEDILGLEDVLLVPGEDLYLKSQPASSAGQVGLASVGAFGMTLVGKGVVPIAPDYTYVQEPFLGSPVFQTGDDVRISWALSTGSITTGAGAQGAGTALGDPVIPGAVTIELLNASNVLRATIGVDADTPSYLITNATLVSAFSGEPTSFKVRIYHAANGQVSPASPTLTITRI